MHVAWSTTCSSTSLNQDISIGMSIFINFRGLTKQSFIFAFTIRYLNVKAPNIDPVLGCEQSKTNIFDENLSVAGKKNDLCKKKTSKSVWKNGKTKCNKSSIDLRLVQ